MSIANQPAFPQAQETLAVNPEGMTLRQWLAGMALQGLISNPEYSSTPEGYAQDAAKHADALIAVLEKVNK